jgi:hypothetical protein
MNPADPALQKALRDSREFDKLELVLEDSEIPAEVLEETRALLMKLTGKRKIDETPAALHDVMEQFGRDKLARAEKVIEWAEPAGFPCPTAFDEGKDAIESVLALANPVHRVKQIHARRDDLKRGVEAIDQVATFHEKWRIAFTELKTFAGQLHVIEHLLPSGSAAGTFLGEYEAARSGARFAEMEVWKQIQSLKASAGLELQSLLSAWRDEARRIVENALTRLPSELKQLMLPEELAKEMAAPLNAFVETSGKETDPARVSALRDRARRLVDELGTSMRQEVEKRAPKPKPNDPQPSPPRETLRVGFSDVAVVRRIRTVPEWETLLKKLDERVRSLLSDNVEVELD